MIFSGIWGLMRDFEKRPDAAWIRIGLHDDTEIAEYDGKKVLVLAGESPIVYTSLSAPELEMPAGCEWLHSGRPPVPDGFHCFAIVRD